MDFTTGLSSVEFDCLPINSDEYRILMHKKMVLGGSGADSPFNTSTMKKNYAKISFYYKLNRQLRFDGTEQSPVSDRIWLVWWCDEWFKDPGDLANVGRLQMQHFMTCYFREPMAVYK